MPKLRKSLIKRQVLSNVLVLGLSPLSSKHTAFPIPFSYSSLLFGTQFRQLIPCNCFNRSQIFWNGVAASFNFMGQSVICQVWQGHIEFGLFKKSIYNQSITIFNRTSKIYFPIYFNTPQRYILHWEENKCILSTSFGIILWSFGLGNIVKAVHALYLCKRGAIKGHLAVFFSAIYMEMEQAKTK